MKIVEPIEVTLGANLADSMRIARNCRRLASADFYGVACASSALSVSPGGVGIAAVRVPPRFVVAVSPLSSDPRGFGLHRSCQHLRLTRRSSGTLRDKAAQRPWA